MPAAVDTARGFVADRARLGVALGTADVLTARGERVAETLRDSPDPVEVFRILVGAGIVGAGVVRVQKAGCEVVAGRLLIGVRSELLLVELAVELFAEAALTVLAKVTPPEGAAEVRELLVEFEVLPELEEWALLLLPAAALLAAAEVVEELGAPLLPAGCGDEARAAKGLCTMERRRLSVPLTRACRVSTACSTLLSAAAGSGGTGRPMVLVVSWLSMLPRFRSFLPPHVSLLVLTRFELP